MSDTAHAFLAEAQKRLSELTTVRADLEREFAQNCAQIDAQIRKWKGAIDGVMAIVESEQGDPTDVEISSFIGGKAGGRQKIKFTDGVRLCLKQSGNKLAFPQSVREGLINLGFDFGKYAQPMVPIHNCLKRLVEQGEAQVLEDDDGNIGYKWISPIERALAENNNPSFMDELGVGLATLETPYETVAQYVNDAAGLQKTMEKRITDQAAIMTKIEAQMNRRFEKRTK
jgi:hypothetical protein